ncbi:MAG TPA: Nramp family divalent metal transporter, partial [Solirubrobacteraceae bacterium]|nr:Nramp family divalent metal transporter [Solirubrobacteraceae bacterium]
MNEVALEATVVPSPLEQLLARGRLRGTLAMLGPAFVAAVAYVDPGNFATNLQGGAKYGYLLLWVVLAANLMAMLIQYLSAKLGVVSGHDLPELCRERYRLPVSWGLWLQAEVMAMATDVAELLGAALGLNLLFGVPMLPAGLIAGVIAFAILALQNRGYRRFELAVSALLGIIFLGFLYEALRIGPSVSATAGGLLPGLHGEGSLYLAVGIVGATVMPHVIYLHSALTQHRIVPRNDEEAKTLYRYTRIDVLIAMVIAGLINMSMLVIAATVFFGSGLTNVESLEGAHRTLQPLLGGASSVLFALALTASGLSSSTVGTMSGQVVMQGFIQRRIPLFVRRFVTMIPAFIV